MRIPLRSSLVVLIASFVMETRAGSPEDFGTYQQKTLGDKLPALPLSMKVYGSIFQTAYYFTDIILGAPHPHEYSMIVDTGSSTQGLPCSSCKSCGKQHWEQPYPIEKSEYQAKVPCGNCTTCRLTTDKQALKQLATPLANIPLNSTTFSTESAKLLLNNPEVMQCLYNVHYAEGSRLQGLFYTDVLWMNLEKVKHKSLHILKPDHKTHDHCPDFPLKPGPSLPINVPVGCHVEETHLFHDQKASGILGLEFWGTRGITTFPTSILNNLHTLYNDDKFTKADCGNKAADTGKNGDFQYSFSMCLSPKGGSLVFGGTSEEFRAKGHTAKTIPLLSHTWRSQSYTVGLTNVAVLKNATLSPTLHSPEYFDLQKDDSMWIEVPLNHPSSLVQDGHVTKVIPTLIDSGTTLTYMPPRLFGELLFHIENRVAVNTGIRDKQKLLLSNHRALERVAPASLFASPDVEVVIRDRFMTKAEKGRSQRLEFIPVATALVSTGPKRLVRVSSDSANVGGRSLLQILETQMPPHLSDSFRGRRLSSESPPGWYAVLEPSADPANEPLDALVGFLDLPVEMEAAAPRALISKLDGYNNGECWWLQDPAKDLPMFPTLKYTFYPDKDIFWHPLSYMYSGSNQHFWCLAMMTDAGRSDSHDRALDTEAIFGSNSFIYQDVTFRHDGIPTAADLDEDGHHVERHTSEYRLHEKGTLEFAEADCPQIAIEK